MKIQLIFFVILLLFCQCSSVIVEPPGPYPFSPISKNFIKSYIKLDSVDFTVAGDTISNRNNISFILKYKSGEIYSMNISQSNPNKAEFNRLAKMYNDTSFNQPGNFVFHDEPCLTDTIISIDVICINREYNQTHPINSKMNDIINISYSTAKNFIDNHYPINKIEKGEDSVYFNIPLAQFNMCPKILVGMRYIKLSISEPPSETSDFAFIISLVLKNGKNFSHTFNSIKLRRN